MSRQKVGQSQNGAVHHICRDDLYDQIKKKYVCIFYKSYVLKEKRNLKKWFTLDSLKMWL